MNSSKYNINNNQKNNSNINNASENKFRILSSNSNLNANQMNNLKLIEMRKVDNVKSKIISSTSDTDILFNAVNKGKLSRNFDSNKIVSKNISKKILNHNNNYIDNENRTHYLNESLQQKNDVLHRSNSNNSFNLNEPLYNSLKRPKIVAKISKGVLFPKNKN